jgi:hypothetical protein
MSITLTRDLLQAISTSSKVKLFETIFSLQQETESYLPRIIETIKSDDLDRLTRTIIEPNNYNKLNNTSDSLSSPFTSAGLSFSAPLVLPILDTIRSQCEKKNIRYAKKVPVAARGDKYTVKTEEEINKIIKDIDDGTFVGPNTWKRGKKYHPENYNVQQVIKTLTNFGKLDSYTINMKLPRLCMTRITPILRELKIQGIITVESLV